MPTTRNNLLLILISFFKYSMILLGLISFPKIKSDSEGSEDDTVIISDSDEAQFVHSSTNYKSSDVGSGEIKDASLMAKAISSILAEET